MGEYFANDSLGGEPVFTQIDSDINFYWEHGALSPKIPGEKYSVRWTIYLKAPVSGTYHLGCWGSPQLSISFEGKTILNHKSKHHGFNKESPVEMEAGKLYKFVYEFKNTGEDGDARFLWSVPNPDIKENALKIACESDVVVLVMGLSQRLEGEEMRIEVDGFKGGDRTHMKLPQTQCELMKAFAELGKPTVLVLMNGSALSVNRANENLDAILSAGYAGQKGGNAVADVLFGDYNPAGRLPVTYYKSVDQLPPFDNYDMEGRTYRYFKDEPLYPFGYGLSYTTFSYSNLIIPEKIEAGDQLEVKVTVTNSGEMAGDEVVQLYLTDEKASTPRPIRQLEGFQRINLKPGESKEVVFNLEARQLSIIGKNEKRVIEPEWFTVIVGGMQPGVIGIADGATSGIETGRFRVVGKTKRVE